MKSQAIQCQGKTYRYILSLLDVFSRFHWLCLLQTNHSRGVKENIKKICCSRYVRNALIGYWDSIQRVSEANLPNEKDNGPISTIQTEGTGKSGVVSSCLEKKDIL